MHKKFNLLANILKYIVIQNDTGSDILVFVSATGLISDKIESNESEKGIALGGGKRLVVQDESCSVSSQTIKHGKRQRIFLLESKSYITVIAQLSNGKGYFILVDNILVKKGRIYYITADDYTMGFDNYMLQT